MRPLDDPALCDALERGDLARARERLAAGSNPDARWTRSDLGERVLHLAVWNRSVAAIELLLEHGATVDIRDRRGDTPLLAAVRWWPERGDLGVVRRLLAAGAHPNARRRKLDATALHLAVGHDASELVEVLLAAGADPNALAERAELTPLRVARSSRSVRALLDGGADPALDAPIVRFIGQVGPAVTLAERLACIDLLLAHGAPVDIGCCYLALGAQSGHLEIVDRLLTAGADPRCRDADGSTPLSFAIDDDPAILRRLLQAGADPRDCDALHLAARMGRLEAIDLLLAAGADPDATDRLGRRPLDVADDPAVRERLAPLTAPAAPAVGRRPRRTIAATLHEAAASGDLPALEARLAAGDDPNATTGPQDARPLHVAATPEVIARLIAAGADPAGRDRDGQTPLHGAIALADHLTREALLVRVEALLTAGAPVDARDAQGSTALELAIDSGSPELVARLLDAGADLEEPSFEDIRPVVRAALAATDTRRRAVLQLLLDRGADVRRHEGGHTLLHDLALAGPLEAIPLVLAAGADTEARDASGLRPRDWASEPALRAALTRDVKRR